MNLIRRKRREAELSQRELAAALGVTQQCVSFWERAARQPSPDTRRELARLLGTSVSELFPEGRP